MPWNPAHPGPANFSNVIATQFVNNADFTHIRYVGISQQQGNTKQVFTLHDYEGWRICVVRHAHFNNTTGQYNLAGNSYIPGWDNWQINTPVGQLNQIAGLANHAAGGFFGGNARYPQAPDTGWNWVNP